MSWVEVAPLTDLPRDRGVRVKIGDHRVALFRVEEQVYAIGDRCSHAEASLSEGDVFGIEVECPLHGSAFDLQTGEALGLPATRPVPVYETKVDDGVVFLAVEDE